MLGIVGIVGRIGKLFVCGKCELYKEVLEVEREKREFYEKLLLTKAGILREDEVTVSNLEDYPTVRRATTLSMARRMAVAASANKALVNKEAAERFEKSVSENK